MTDTRDLTVTIIGSGPTGLALAMGLKKIGLDPTVFEQRSKEQVIKGNEDRSVNITISSRGISALKRLGCLEEFMKASVDVVGRTYFINEKPYFVPYTLLPGHSLRSIERKDLEHIMIQEAERCGIKIKFGHRLSEVNTHTSACKFLHEGKEVESGYSFLFGADGVNSRVRDSLCIPYSMSRPDHVYKKVEITVKNATRLGLGKNRVNIWPNPRVCY